MVPGIHPKPSRRRPASISAADGEGGFGISKIVLDSVASVPDIDDAAFQEQAETTKQNCPVSKALAAVPIEVNASLAD